MTDARDFSVVLFLVLVAISAYLATVRAIGGAALGWCILASAAAVMLVRNVDRLEQLVFRRGDDQLLVQIRQAQKDVYAKIEELQRIADGVARFTVASIVAETPANPLQARQDSMLRRRDELDTFLRDAGIPEDRRSELLSPILHAVANEHLNLIRTLAYQAVVNSITGTAEQRDTIRRELLQPLQAADRPAAVQDMLRVAAHYKIRGDDLFNAIDRYRLFLEQYPQARRAPR